MSTMRPHTRARRWEPPLTYGHRKSLAKLPNVSLQTSRPCTLRLPHLGLGLCPAPPSRYQKGLWGCWDVGLGQWSTSCSGSALLSSLVQHSPCPPHAHHQPWDCDTRHRRDLANVNQLGPRAGATQECPRVSTWAHGHPEAPREREKAAGV